MKKLIFLPLLATYPILFLATSSPGQVEWRTVALVAFVAVVASIVAGVFLRSIARSTASAAVATTLLVVMFFAYGHFADYIDRLGEALDLGNHEVPNVLDLYRNARVAIACVWAAIAVFAAWRVARAKWSARDEVVKTLNFASISLVTLAMFAPVWGWLTHRSDAAGSITTLGGDSDRVGHPSAVGRPDVYFIVLDGYARQDVLARYYGTRNDRFLTELRARNFSVSTESSSNYNWTFLSLASTLNLGYIHDLFANDLTATSIDRSIVYDRIRDNETARFLRARGYRTVHVQSTWGATSTNPYANQEIRCQQGLYSNEFVRVVAEASWLRAFNSRAGADLARCHLANFEALSHMGSEPGPKFVFAHFVLPHHPYLFDRDGTILRNAVVSNQFEFQRQLWEDRAAYAAQLEFVNHKVIETIDAILGASATPPIIVLASDHGPGITRGLGNGEYAALRLANLGAYHLPGAPTDLIPNAGSAVNQFRNILSYYFDADLPPLPDRHFVSSTARPYAFREVPHDLLKSWWTVPDTAAQALHSNKILASETPRENVR